MAALNQLDSAYGSPPPSAPLAARHEKLRLSIHFYRSCFSISLPHLRHSSARSRSRLHFFQMSPSLFLPHVLLTLFFSFYLAFDNRSRLRSIARHTEELLPCPFACHLVTDFVFLFSSSSSSSSSCVSAIYSRQCSKRKVNLISIKSDIRKNITQQLYGFSQISVRNLFNKKSGSYPRRMIISKILSRCMKNLASDQYYPLMLLKLAEMNEQVDYNGFSISTCIF